MLEACAGSETANRSISDAALRNPLVSAASKFTYTDRSLRRCSECDMS